MADSIDDDPRHATPPTPSSFIRHGHRWAALLTVWQTVNLVVAGTQPGDRDLPARLALLADGLMIVDADECIRFSRARASLVAPFATPEAMLDRYLSDVFPPDIVGQLRYGIDSAYALNEPFPVGYFFYADQYRAYVMRNAIAVPSPHRAQATILTWHRGLRGFGATPHPSRYHGDAIQ